MPLPPSNWERRDGVLAHGVLKFGQLGGVVLAARVQNGLSRQSARQLPFPPLQSVCSEHVCTVGTCFSVACTKSDFSCSKFDFVCSDFQFACSESDLLERADPATILAGSDGPCMCVCMIVTQHFWAAGVPGSIFHPVSRPNVANLKTPFVKTP